MKSIYKLYHMMLSEKENLEEKIESVREQIRSLPAGNLICARNGNHFKWYQSEGSKASSSYIPKSNRFLAEQLAAKKYLSLQERELLQELKAVNSYLNCHSLNGEETAGTLSEHSEYAELLSSYFKPLSKELSDWALAPYERSNSHPEQLLHRTVSGIYVRSKSEAVIAALLHMNKIPFRYECALQLGEIVIYPDFTIRHPRTGKIFYWEHFGMMDNLSYSRKAMDKLELYTANGIYPSIDLLMTFETKEASLNSEAAEKMLSYYFLER